MEAGRLLWRGAAAAALAVLGTPGAAPAEQVSFPHGVVESTYTTTRANAPSGGSYFGRYHAAGDPQGRPPYMRRMVFYNPSGARRDTSVPQRCGATDLELALRGPEACPAGSRLGGGRTITSFMEQPPTEVDIVLFNNENEQIILARSPLVATVARGRIGPDGSIEFASPTCFPALQPVPCPVDTVLQLQTKMESPPYVRTGPDGSVRSYLTTPAKCPKRGYWESPIRFWWKDGSEDLVVTRQPCKRPASPKRGSRGARTRR